MKKLTLLVFAVLLLLVSTNLHAQEKAHRFYIGGSGAFSISEYDIVPSSSYESEYRNFSYSLSPVLGYFISDRLMLGAEFEFSNSVSGEKYLDPRTYSYYTIREGSIGFNLLVKYHHSFSDKLSLAVNTGLGTGKSGRRIVEEDASTTSMAGYLLESGTLEVSFFVNPEFQLHFTERVGINLTCDLFSYVYEEKQNIATSPPGTHDLSFTLTPANWRFGVFYRF